MSSKIKFVVALSMALVTAVGIGRFIINSSNPPTTFGDIFDLTTQRAMAETGGDGGGDGTGGDTGGGDTGGGTGGDDSSESGPGGNGGV